MVEQLYKNIDGNYNEALSRMQNDERIIKYLKFFIEDTSYEELKNAMNCNDTKNAFIAAHTLKGVCKNMAFTSLSSIAQEITEYLREDNYEKALEIFPEVTKKYNLVIDQIKKII